MLIPELGGGASQPSCTCWQQGDLKRAIGDIHLSFSAGDTDEAALRLDGSGDDDASDGGSSDQYESEDGDEIEIHLPEMEDTEYVGRKRMHAAPVGPALRWASHQLLSLEDKVKLDAANALLDMRFRSLRMKALRQPSPSSEARLANELDALFSRANAELQHKKQTQERTREQEHTRRRQSQDRIQSIATQAEAAIAAFLKQKAVERQEAIESERVAREAKQKELEEKKKHEELEKRKAEEQAAKEAALRAKSEADKKAKEDERKRIETAKQALRSDTTTIVPVFDNRSTLRAFGDTRAELFREVSGRVKQAPFNPDQKSFLEVNEILGRFAPNPSDLSPLDEISKNMVSIVNKHDLDLHSCNLAASFLKQVRNKVFQQPDLASGFAELWIHLETQLSKISVFILAGVFYRCPPTMVKFSPEKEYSTTQACSLRAVVRVYAAYLQKSPSMPFELHSVAPVAHSVFADHFALAWNWLSSVLQKPAFPLSSECSGLLMFLEVAAVTEYAFFRAYGSQGRKLIMYMAKVFLPQLGESSGVLGSDVENLRAFLTPELILKANRSGTGTQQYILKCLK